MTLVDLYVGAALVGLDRSSGAIMAAHHRVVAGIDRVRSSGIGRLRSRCFQVSRLALILVRTEGIVRQVEIGRTSHHL